MDAAASSTSDARALASELAATDDADIARLLAARGVSASAPWHDFFDAAEALLEPASIDRALSRLSRSDLAALAAAGSGGIDAAIRPHVAGLALVHGDGRLLRAVSARLAALAHDRPDAFAPPEPTRTAPASVAEEAVAAERGASSSASLADVLLASLTFPPTRTGAGAVSAVDRRRFVESGAVATAEELDELLESAVAARLAARAEREWLVTPAGEDWLTAPTAQRWAAVAEGVVAALPAGLRAAGGGHVPLAEWRGAYPLDPEWPARAELLRRIALRWGLVAESGSEPSWMTPLRESGTADPAAFAALLPREIDRIYLQADLTAIAPGPLEPSLDLRLRRAAVRESRAQASTYRFTSESIAAAVAGGETAESLRGFLSALSLTGIPQPLDYLIERTASQHGLIRVRTDASIGRTRVDSDDPGVLDTLLVDQSVRPIGLVRDGQDLTSRVARDAVYWTLVDARYPVVAVDAAGEPEPLHRRRLAPDGGDVAAPATHARLLATLRAARETDTDAAWLGRELDAAVRTRATIVVVVRLPDGSDREFTLEATGLGGGRLRGRDRGSDTERTLPVSSIVSARPA